MSTDVEVLTRCQDTHQLFKIVFREQEPGTWAAYRVLVPRVQSRAEAAGAGHTTPSGLHVTGMVGTDPTYKGCPFCPSKSFWTCGTCQEFNCWDERLDVVCAWCTHAGRVVGKIDHLRGQAPSAGGPTSRRVPSPPSPPSQRLSTPNLPKLPPRR